MAAVEPHKFVQDAPGTRNAEFGWCAYLDCGWVQDAYVHASKEERAAFNQQLELERAKACHRRAPISVDWTVTVTDGDRTQVWVERAPGPMAALIQITEKRQGGR